MRWLLGAALILLAAPLQAAQSLDAGSAIDACIPRLDPELDVGYEQIAARCPDLARSLEQSDFAQWLPRGWKESRNNLSAGSLTELRAVVAREQTTRTAAHKPRIEHLGVVLATLGTQHAEAPGVWSRFKRWVRGLTARTETADRRNWLDQMVGPTGISDAMLEVIQFLALGVMVVLAGYVALNEWRAAGLSGRRARRVTKLESEQQLHVRSPPDLGQIERAAPRYRAGMLLELICSRLTALRRLPPATSLTVRELTKSAQLPDAQDNARLAELALAAERARFAAAGISEPVLIAELERGRELLKRVETMSAPTPQDSGP